jgi:hypothetical protein
LPFEFNLQRYTWGIQGRIVNVASNMHHFTYRVKRGTAKPSRGGADCLPTVYPVQKNPADPQLETTRFQPFSL